MAQESYPDELSGSTKCPNLDMAHKAKIPNLFLIKKEQEISKWEPKNPEDPIIIFIFDFNITKIQLTHLQNALNQINTS